MSTIIISNVSILNYGDLCNSHGWNYFKLNNNSDHAEICSMNINKKIFILAAPRC